MTLAGLESISEYRFRLTGGLTLSSVAELNQLFYAQVPVIDGVSIELDAVRRVDSAGLVLLLSWMRLFKTQGIAIRFLDPSAQMRSIAELSDLDSILFSDTGS